MKKKRISALTLSGGKLSDFGAKAIREWRIWCHPIAGDDFYYRFPPSKFAEAIETRAKLLKDESIVEVEPIIAVVWDEESKDFREVIVE